MLALLTQLHRRERCRAAKTPVFQTQSVRTADRQANGSQSKRRPSSLAMVVDCVDMHESRPVTDRSGHVTLPKQWQPASGNAVTRRVLESPHLIPRTAVRPQPQNYASRTSSTSECKVMEHPDGKGQFE